MLRFASWSLTNGSQFQYCEYELKFWCFGLCRLWKTVTDGHSYKTKRRYKTYKTETRQWPCITNWSVSRIYITVQWTNLLYLTPSVRLSGRLDGLGFWNPDNRLRIPYQWNLNSKSRSSSRILHSWSWIPDSTSPGFRILQAKFLGYTLTTWDVTHASPGSFG